MNGQSSNVLVASRTFHILDQALFHLHDLALRRPGLTLTAALLFVAALCTQIPGTRVLLAIGDFVEETLPSTLWNRQLREDFDSGNPVIVIFKPRSDGARLSPHAIERIATWIERERSNNPELLRVVSPFNLRRVRLAGGRFWSWPLMRDRTSEGLATLRKSPWDRILTDRAAVDVAVEFTFRDTLGGSRYGSFDPTVISSLERRYTDEVLANNEEVEAHLLGTAAFQHYTLAGIRRFRLLNLGVLALVLILCRALLGTWRSGALLIGVLIVAGVTVYGTMGLAGAPIDLLSTGLFLMLSVAALEDYVFLSYQQLHHGTEWRTAFRNMLLPSFFTSLTTMIGFGSLVSSDLELVRRFGMWAAYGASIEWIVTFMLLPAVMKLLPACRRWTHADRAWGIALPARLAATSLPRRAALLLLLVYGFGAFGAAHLNTADSPVTTFPPGHPHRDGQQYLASSRGWEGPISIVFPNAGRQQANRDALARLGQHPNVAMVTDPYETLRYTTGVVLADSDRPAPDDDSDTASHSSLFSSDGQARGVLYLRDIGLERMQETIRFVYETCAQEGCHPAGDLVSYADFASEVPATMFASLTTCLVLVGAVVLALLLLSKHGARLRILAATFWGPTCMITVLWLAQVPVNFLTCVFASVLVGLTGDNAVQYLFAARYIPEGIARRGGASILVALVMGLACLTFLGSSFVASQRLGILMALGFAASLLGDIWILKALLETTRTPIMRPSEQAS